MQYFKIETLGDQSKLKENVVISENLVALKIKAHFPATGRSIIDKYPDDLAIALSDRFPGVKLTPFISNTKSLLIFDDKCKAIIEEVCAGEDIEYLPLTINDHQGSKLTSDYWIINPLTKLNCLKHEDSDIKYVNDDPTKKVIRIGSFVLDPSKLNNAPHLFRISEDPHICVMDEVLGRQLSEVKPENLTVTPLKLER